MIIRNNDDNQLNLIAPKFSSHDLSLKWVGPKWIGPNLMNLSPNFCRVKN